MAEPDAVVARNLCKQYRLRRLVATGMSAVDSMITDGPDVADDDPRLVSALQATPAEHTTLTLDVS